MPPFTRRHVFIVLAIASSLFTLKYLWPRLSDEYLRMAYTPNITPVAKALTFTYKEVDDHPILIDVYPPTLAHNHRIAPAVPAVLYFHGGGLTVGNRASWFPSWLQKRVCAAGFAFISADYRLMPPATGHEIIHDIQDLFSFLASEENKGLNHLLDESATLEGFTPFHVDPHKIAVAGSSAGGQCAYYAAMHATPKPKALLGFYAMGGEYLTPQYLIEKTVPFFRGREILDRADFVPYLYPHSASLSPMSDSPLSYHPDTGYPTNQRMVLSRLYIQLGILLDYLTGQHTPSLSSTLQASLGSDKPNIPGSTYPYAKSEEEAFDVVNERLKQLIPEKLLSLFPQFSVTPSWPPTYLVHGANDTAVLAHESYHMHRLLSNAGVDSRLTVVEGKEHSFDYEPDAEELHGKDVFDEVVKWLDEQLGK